MHVLKHPVQMRENAAFSPPCTDGVLLPIRNVKEALIFALFSCHYFAYRQKYFNTTSKLYSSRMFSKLKFHNLTVCISEVKGANMQNPQSFNCFLSCLWCHTHTDMTPYSYWYTVLTKPIGS
jgi:hypothetical protein